MYGCGMMGGWIKAHDQDAGDPYWEGRQGDFRPHLGVAKLGY